MALLLSSHKDGWVIDSGTTDHMSSNLKNLTNVNSKSALLPITVANGQKIPIQAIGKTKLLSSTSDALFVQSLTSNLLSVSKITNDLDSDAIFSPKFVIFQDRVTGKKIGEGRVSQGLYILDMQQKALLARNKAEFSLLWHKRTGHPSNQILHVLDSSLTVHECENVIFLNNIGCHFQSILLF